MFDQLDSTNWFHPLGFAYFPDGAHEGVEELEEGIGNGEGERERERRTLRKSSDTCHTRCWPVESHIQARETYNTWVKHLTRGTGCFC